VNTNVRDEHLRELSFRKCHVYVPLLSEADLGIKKKPSVSRQKGMEVARVLFR